MYHISLLFLRDHLQRLHDYLESESLADRWQSMRPCTREGVLNAYPVRPVMGNAALFPHGDTSALLHEGTGVRKGAKYVIRTEVEYDVEPSGK